MNATVADIGRWVDEHGVRCGFERGGYLHVARTEPQRRMLLDRLDVERSAGLADDDEWLDPPAVDDRVVVAGNARGPLHAPLRAAVDPGRLVRGLATICERRGCHDPRALPPCWPSSPGAVHNRVRRRSGELGRSRDRGVHESAARAAARRCAVVLPHDRHRAVARRRVARDPLERARDRERRTTARDLRAAHGGWPHRVRRSGRAVPLGLEDRRPLRSRRRRAPGSWRAPSPSCSPPPAAPPSRTGGAGPSACPRDWHPSVGFDGRTRVGWAGGYVGDGVASAHLAGRTLAALIDGRDDPRSSGCRGSDIAAHGGNPNHCGGSPSAACCS